MERIDVVVLTKDSEHLLERCLNSIYQNIPVNKLIIVDGYSKDNTLKILQEFNKKYKNIKVFLDNGNRATARQKGIREVETEWFAFVDSDKC
ncbi:MAG: glycosyltransferase family A protein [Candidatus Bathyarchaeia archaeon]|nr:glycosyltransferase family A protein [Candidatus Bathyarchaeia archaeon]